MSQSIPIDAPLRMDFPADRLRMVHECFEALHRGTADTDETLEAIASAIYGEEVYSSDARNAALDAAHADPELNRVADLRTACDEMGTIQPHEMVALCDAYMGLRAQCPPGSVVVVQTGGCVNDDGDPCTLFDAVRGAIDFSGNIVGIVTEVQ